MSTWLHAAVSWKSKKEIAKIPSVDRNRRTINIVLCLTLGTFSLNRHLELIINFMAHASAVYVLFASFKMSIDHDIKRIVNVNYCWGEKMILFFRFHVWQQKEIKNFIFSLWFSCLEPLTNWGMKLTRKKDWNWHSLTRSMKKKIN